MANSRLINVQCGCLKWAVPGLDIQFGFLKWATPDLDIQFIYFKIVIRLEYGFRGRGCLNTQMYGTFTRTSASKPPNCPRRKRLLRVLFQSSSTMPSKPLKSAMQQSHRAILSEHLTKKWEVLYIYIYIYTCFIICI